MERFLGFPTVYGDKLINEITWGQPKVLDEDGRLILREKYSSNRQVVNLEFDFTHKRYTISYVTWSDVLSKIGGLRSVILPFIEFFIPLLMLLFLVELITIVQEQTKKTAVTEARKVLIVGQR